MAHKAASSSDSSAGVTSTSTEEGDGATLVDLSGECDCVARQY